MKVSIQFQYMYDEKRRPEDGADNIRPIEADDDQFLPVPRVGDTVIYDRYEYDYTPEGRLIESSGREIRVARKVKTVNYSYYENSVGINIVVIDVPKGEMGMRLKE